MSKREYAWDKRMVDEMRRLTLTLSPRHPIHPIAQTRQHPTTLPPQRPNTRPLTLTKPPLKVDEMRRAAPRVARLPWERTCTYRYLLNLDGNAAASRLASLFHTG